MYGGQLNRYKHISEDMGDGEQWVAVTENKIPIDPKTGKAAKVNDPCTWATLEQAISSGYPYIGYMLTNDDPFVIIDLDNKEQDERKTKLHQQIIEQAGHTYIEKSMSGLGYHIVVKADLPKGYKFSQCGVEIYPNNRMIVMTGECQTTSEILVNQELVDDLIRELTSSEFAESKHTYSRPPISDVELEKLVSEKYKNDYFALMRGEWEGKYTSASEADFQLVLMNAEYSSDDGQVLNAWKKSALSRRDKPNLDQKIIRYAIPKARAIADDTKYHIEFGRKIAEAIIASFKRKSRNLLVSLEAFIQRKVKPLKLIEGVLGSGNLSAMYGPPGSGKSFAALDLSYAIATGSNWMGRKVTKGPVIYACGEGISGMVLRAKALCQDKGFIPSNFNLIDRTLDTTNEVNTLIEMLKASEEHAKQAPALLVLDTLSRYFGDELDENSARDMKKFVNALSMVQEVYPDLHVMLVHHSGKDADRGMRGSSVLLGAADTVLAVSKKEDKHTIKVSKQKDGQDGGAIGFTLEEIEMESDDSDETQSTCVVRHDPSGKAPPAKGHLATAIEIILKILKEGPDKDSSTNLTAYFGEFDQSFRCYPITFSSSFSSLPVLP